MGVIHSNGLLHKYREISLYVHNAGHVVYVCVCVTGFLGGTGTK